MRAAVELTPGTLGRSGRGGDLALATSLDSRVSTGGSVTVSSSSTTDTYLHSPALAVWRATCCHPSHNIVQRSLGAVHTGISLVYMFSLADLLNCRGHYFETQTQLITTNVSADQPLTLSCGIRVRFTNSAFILPNLPRPV